MPGSRQTPAKKRGLRAPACLPLKSASLVLAGRALSGQAWWPHPLGYGSPRPGLWVQSCRGLGWALCCPLASGSPSPNSDTCLLWSWSPPPTTLNPGWWNRAREGKSCMEYRQGVLAPGLALLGAESWPSPLPLSRSKGTATLVVDILDCSGDGSISCSCGVHPSQAPGPGESSIPGLPSAVREAVC